MVVSILVRELQNIQDAKGELFFKVGKALKEISQELDLKNRELRINYNDITVNKPCIVVAWLKFSNVPTFDFGGYETEEIIQEDGSLIIYTAVKTKAVMKVSLFGGDDPLSELASIMSEFPHSDYNPSDNTCCLNKFTDVIDNSVPSVDGGWLKGSSTQLHWDLLYKRQKAYNSIEKINVFLKHSNDNEDDE
tara:strand:+ start:784 stop:1359 length:576 start_codon:yes stop_codon:yes gene_type:complete